MSGDAFAFSKSSLACRRSLPSEVIVTSESVGWQCVLLEHHQVHPTKEIFETRATPDQTLVVMTRGEQELECFRGGTWHSAAYRAGTVGMTPGGASDRLRRRIGPTTSPFQKVNLYIPQQSFVSALEHFRRAGQRMPDLRPSSLAFQDPTIAGVCLALLRAIGQGAPDLYAQSAVQWLTIHLLSVHGAWQDHERDRRAAAPLTDRRLVRVMEYMSAHVGEALTLDALAGQAGVSKYHFCRLFRAATGTTPHAALRELRLLEARRLLLSSDLHVKEITVKCGFAQPGHFGTAFRRRFGRSPTAVRARPVAG